MDEPHNNLKDDQLAEQLRRLEERLCRIEEYLQLTGTSAERPAGAFAPLPADVTGSEDRLEYSIGQYWFAQAGIIVLTLGLAFFLTLPYSGLSPLLPSSFGYVITVIIFGLSYSLRTSYTLISRNLLGSGLVLLYFSTLRLHFFAGQPAIADMVVEHALLLGVVTANVMVAASQRSVYLKAVSLTLGYVTALTGGSPYFTLTLITLFSMSAVYFQARRQWNFLTVYCAMLAYLTYALWAIGNPFLGNPVNIITAPAGHVYFILLNGLALSAGILWWSEREKENLPAILSAMLNSSICYGVYLLFAFAQPESSWAVYHAVAAAIFLLLSALFWLREQSKVSTFFYAMTGYFALTVAIVSRFGLQPSLIWLSWQSLLVISTAIWYRSKYIVIANFAIYLILLGAYIFGGQEITPMGLTIGIVALLSARIMSVQQHRLELKTEMMRNAYLGSAFVFFPFALYHLVPKEYVALSWVGVALLYYLLNLVLQRQKYRWMAILTLLLTIGYVLIVGIIGMEPTYRIVSFLALGIVLLVVSMVYTRLRAKKPGATEGQS